MLGVRAAILRIAISHLGYQSTVIIHGSGRITINVEKVGVDKINFENGLKLSFAIKY